MPYVTEDTIWPENTIPPEFKSLIQLFFSLADRKEDDAGPRLASEVFTSAASVIVGQHKITGSAEIASSRKSAWNSIEHRQHKVLKVYSCNQAADDLLLIGKMHAGMKNGEVVEIEFCARMMFQHGKEKTPKVNLYQAWMDPSLISAAAKGA